MKAYILQVPYTFQGKKDFLYPVLLKNEKELILVDCGYPGFMPLIEEAANLHGLSLKNLTGILLTHDDIDHVGGLYEIKTEYPALKIYTSKVEEPYISGKEKSLRLQQAEEMYEALPEEHKPRALKFQEMLRSIKPVAVDYTFSKEEDSTFLDDAVIIYTPGHTPGHISLYLRDSKTLIAADAVVVENEEFEIANPNFTLDLEQAVASVQKLLELDIAQIICYHGGSVTKRIKLKLEKLVSTYTSVNTKI